MNLEPNKYFGITTKSLKTESFNISLTNHLANSKISLHSHEKPYLCLLASGTYIEESNITDIIIQGEVLYRTANYEHSNSFSDKGGLCLNIEINNHQKFTTLNELHLPLKVSKQKGILEMYKLLYGIKRCLSNDIINIYCYESMIAVMNVFNGKGDINWVKKIKELINDNPLETISLDKLSIEFSLHPNYIVRKFKEITGFKLSEYLTKIRLEHSVKQLLISNENITSIALENGFYDQSHFNRNFKKHIDTTPNNFRKVITG
ncbi:AraC family transcriptional regulator [Polaribacter litorisediminis]|uniref:helix-turn-helix transcriptional regulator n=1 Tax=Polaribacter litorisediminis TaxID=1908341 RepID=UPI001CBFB3BB|nr:AraC family transcriptional regulator [Polaribacter litorisediminis]UAM98377.1 AraC family transcriptional regulator [Polaribacter litorisediminis]